MVTRQDRTAINAKYHIRLSFARRHRHAKRGKIFNTIMDFSPLKIDVSKLSYHLVVYTVSPFFPGVILLFGFAISRPTLFTQLMEYRALGYYFKVGVLVFLS